MPVIDQILKSGVFLFNEETLLAYWVFSARPVYTHTDSNETVKPLYEEELLKK